MITRINFNTSGVKNYKIIYIYFKVSENTENMVDRETVNSMLKL